LARSFFPHSEQTRSGTTSLGLESASFLCANFAMHRWHTGTWTQEPDILSQDSQRSLFSPFFTDRDYFARGVIPKLMQCGPA